MFGYFLCIESVVSIKMLILFKSARAETTDVESWCAIYGAGIKTGFNLPCHYLTHCRAADGKRWRSSNPSPLWVNSLLSTILNVTS